MTTPLLLVLPDSRDPSKVKHYEGLPPEVTGGKDTRTELGPAAFLVIEAKESGIFLFRYDCSGRCVGDTWHMSVEDAKHQVQYEYGPLSENWEEVPNDVEDVLQLGLKRLTEGK